jgi:hypothetical protein
VEVNGQLENGEAEQVGEQLNLQNKTEKDSKRNFVSRPITSGATVNLPPWVNFRDTRSWQSSNGSRIMDQIERFKEDDISSKLTCLLRQVPGNGKFLNLPLASLCSRRLRIQ